MLKWLGDAFVFLSQATSWVMLVLAVFTLILLVDKRKKHVKWRFAQWVRWILSVAYILAFLIGKIFFPDWWNGIWEFVVMFVLMIGFWISRPDWRWYTRHGGMEKCVR